VSSYRLARGLATCAQTSLTKTTETKYVPFPGYRDLHSNF